MEAFSLLKYWRGGGSGLAGGGPAAANTPTTSSITTSDAAVRQQVETDDDDDDEGPFFDLEFTVPDDEEGEGGDYHDNDEEDDNEDGGGGDEDDSDLAGTDGEREFNFTVSSVSSGDPTDPNLSFSPSDDLFFKGRLVPLESSSLVFNPSEPNSKHQFPVSLLKSATKFRVFMLGFKKPKPTSTTTTTTTTTEKTETNEANMTSPEDQQPDTQQQQKQQQDNHHHSKLFTVKFKVEEVPIISLFTRDGSSRSSANKQQKQNSDETATDDKRFSKDMVQKYLKMIKPLYIRVSRRYGEKIRFSGHLSLGSGKAASSPVAAETKMETPVSSPTTANNNHGEAEEAEAPTSNNAKPLLHKQVNIPAGLRVVRKHLGKSRSASSAVAAIKPVASQSRRRDDSLLQQQDGIQSAILHCKRSFNASKDSDHTLLSRSASDPSHEKSICPSKNSSEGNDSRS
ncbi:PREDICTED: probable membrane-associated kinase regulator 2 [Nelumbo nucifera]|uniref:Membrane-associated kinase regulator 2 n=2 Tax=Nelumbo nucifera TaxID=4432 RepID=A0A822ZAB5_NELNU|nr:PREDICTED: probable membrane-associated kinase regulator 2 [Nelumbo nucifera]DAD43224.1 TPA_asm: hypothetical protein HUJ06_001454 [Nelumbo nucifera]